MPRADPHASPAAAPAPAAEVRAWLVTLDLPPRRLARLQAHLSPAERERASRFHRAPDRDRFVVTRGLLRELLAGELGMAQDRVPLGADENGKPALDARAGAPQLRFNASHSDARALVVVAFGREVGADVERVRPDLDLDGVAERTFSTAELTDWERLPAAERVPAFFTAWARKEAYAKGIGRGLAVGMSGIQPEPSARPGRLVVADPHADGRPWAVCDVDAGPGYAAAVAAEGEDWELRLEPVPS